MTGLMRIYIVGSEAAAALTTSTSAMEHARFLTAFLLIIIIVGAIHGSPFNGDRDLEGLFRKKPLRRGGCSAFGHSCFGGHGKRSGDPTLEQLQQRRLQTLPTSDLIKQWLQSYHNSVPLVDDQ